MESGIKATLDKLKPIWKDWKDCFGIGPGTLGVPDQENLFAGKRNASPPPDRPSNGSVQGEKRRGRLDESI